MAFQVSPGVVTREVDLSSIIPAVSTTVAGYVGHFQWGPVDQLVTVDSENNLVALFGKPNDNNYKEWFPAANFLGYGNNLKVARVVGNSTAALNSAGPSAANATHSLIKNDSDLANAITTVGASAASGDSFLSWHARYPGELGNSLKVVWHDGGAATGDNGLDDSSEGVSASAYNAWTYAGNFQTKLPNNTAWAQTLTGQTTDNAIYDAVNIAVIDEDGLISGNAGTVLEVFDGLSKASNAKNSDGTVNYYRTVINESSKYVFATGHPELDGGFNAHGVCGGNLRWGAELTGAGGTFDVYYGSGGSTSGYTTSLSGGKGFTSGTISTSGNSSGYGLFSDADTVDVSVLICGALGGTQSKAVIELAEARKDCVAFCSPEEADVLTNGSPITQSSCETNVLEFRTATAFNVNSSYGFLDSGWKYQYDRYNDKYRWVPLNGDVAGIAVRSDEASETWFSPAGFNRGQVRGVVKLAFNPSKTNRDNLYSGTRPFSPSHQHSTDSTYVVCSSCLRRQSRLLPSTSCSSRTTSSPDHTSRAWLNHSSVMCRQEEESPTSRSSVTQATTPPLSSTATSLLPTSTSNQPSRSTSSHSALSPPRRVLTSQKSDPDRRNQ
jgi:hypothetical protein